MLIVPVTGDRIRTRDDSEPRVVTSYTSLKDEPAVYLSSETSREKFIYFSDIVEINGVRVEYEEGSKVFSGLGPLRRRYELPQPKDMIKVKLVDTPFKEENAEVEVDSIRLHSKKHGIGRGLLICSNKACYPLTDIIDVDARVGKEPFNHKGFMRYYRDYGPVTPSKSSSKS